MARVSFLAFVAARTSGLNLRTPTSMSKSASTARSRSIASLSHARAPSACTRSSSSWVMSHRLRRGRGFVSSRFASAASPPSRRGIAPPRAPTTANRASSNLASLSELARQSSSAARCSSQSRPRCARRLRRNRAITGYLISRGMSRRGSSWTYRDARDILNPPRIASLAALSTRPAARASASTRRVAAKRSYASQCRANASSASGWIRNAAR